VEQGPWETGPSSWPDSWGPKSAWFLTQLGKSFWEIKTSISCYDM
jgi:hypothetical protein